MTVVLGTLTLFLSWALTPRNGDVPASVPAIQAVPSTSDQLEDQVVGSYTFIVDAKAHATRSPLRTGVQLTQGQTIIVEPNPKDTWHTGKGSWVDYHGRTQYPYMTLHAQIAGINFHIDKDRVDFLAPVDGELRFYCRDQWPDNNKGAVNVSVKIVSSRSRIEVAVPTHPG